MGRLKKGKVGDGNFIRHLLRRDNRAAHCVEVGRLDQEGPSRDARPEARHSSVKDQLKAGTHCLGDELTDSWTICDVDLRRRRRLTLRIRTSVLEPPLVVAGRLGTSFDVQRPDHLDVALDSR